MLNAPTLIDGVIIVTGNALHERGASAHPAAFTLGGSKLALNGLHNGQVSRRDTWTRHHGR